MVKESDGVIGLVIARNNVAIRHYLKLKNRP